MTSPISFTWLADAPMQRIFAALGFPEVDVRCVGGCVRDALAARTRGDIDLGTPEVPEAVIKRLEGAGIKVIPTGLAHGTVTALLDGMHFEITSLRRDTSCDGRHAVVEYTTDWREDARRRDFTINAMSLRPPGELFDFFGGAEDVKAGRIQFVGTPADRIQEDYLRILRLFRFHAHFGRAPIDDETLQACARHKESLVTLSAERVTREISKLLMATNPIPSLTAMQACGVLFAVLPEATQLPVLSDLIALEEKLHLPRDWRRRMAALLANTDARALAARLRLSNHDADFLRALLADHPVLDASTALSALDLVLYRLGREIVLNRCLLAAARAPTPHWRTILTRAAAWVPRPMPISGDDLLSLGHQPGPAIGTALQAAEELWVTSAFSATRLELIDCAQQKMSLR
jgi:poly(A) polymerase